MRFVSHSARQTKSIAYLLAKEILSYKSSKKAFVAGLKGDLGSGKTTFIQGLAKGLGVRKTLLSPTFLLMRRYSLRKKRYKNLFHVDAYRIKTPADLLALGLKNDIGNLKNIIVIEWAEKIKRILPKKMIWINFEHGKSENERRIKLELNSKRFNLNHQP